MTTRARKKTVEQKDAKAGSASETVAAADPIRSIPNPPRVFQSVSVAEVMNIFDNDVEFHAQFASWKLLENGHEPHVLQSNERIDAVPK